MNFGEADKKLVSIIVAGFLLGVVANNLSAQIESPAENVPDRVLYDIDSQGEFIESSAVTGWGKDAASFENGRMHIGIYDKWETHGAASSSSYRTELIKAPDGGMQLDNFSLNGYIAENPESSIWVMIHDCTERPDGKPIVDVCYGGGKVILNETIRSSGELDFERDVSNLTVDGYVTVYTEIMTDSDQPLPEDNETYIDSIRLTRVDECKGVKCAFLEYLPV